MTQKTESSPPDNVPELSNAYLGSLVVASVLVLLLVFGGPFLIGNPFEYFFHIADMRSLPLLAPWIVGGGQAIANGLSEFTGHELVPVPNPIRIATLLGVLLLGVITPTLTLLLMGKRSGKASSAPARGVYLVAAIITTTFAVFVLPMGYVASRVTISMQAGQAVQSNKDNIINELNVIAWRMREYRTVPKALGGGGGEIRGYVLPSGVAGSEEAKYTVGFAVPGTAATGRGTLATIHASSKKFTNEGVDVTVYESGQLGNWSYQGSFQ
ncbi:MAG: hypothetical protein WBD36_04730 [Bacteroidota bacterium]